MKGVPPYLPVTTRSLECSQIVLSAFQEFWLPRFSSFCVSEDERKDCFSNILCFYFYSLFLLRAEFSCYSHVQTHVPDGTITVFVQFGSSYKLPKPHQDGFYSAPWLWIKFTNTSLAPIKKIKCFRVGQICAVLGNSHSFQPAARHLCIQTLCAFLSALRKYKWKLCLFPLFPPLSIYFIPHCPCTHTQHTGFLPVP